MLSYEYKNAHTATFMIVVINHGQCNLGSLTNTLRNLGYEYEIWSNKHDSHALTQNDGFILPGVGSYNSGMKELRKTGLDETVYKLIEDKVRGLGICLGMQMLCETSEEGNYDENGLGIFKGKLTRLSTSNGKVPNMGWNNTKTTSSIHNCQSMEECLNNTFYYVHSYALVTDNDEEVVATFTHGTKKATAAIYKESVLGVQFHPEKSQAAGLTLLKKFFS